MLEKVSVDMKALAKSEILSSDINVAFDCSGKKESNIVSIKLCVILKS